MPRPEQIIHKAVIQHIRQRGVPGIFAWHTPSGAFYGGKRNRKGIAIQGSIMKGLGARAGIPDIFVLSKGALYGLELKVEGGKVSDEQFETMKALAVAGATVDVAFGIDAALRWLEGHGLLVGRAA